MEWRSHHSSRVLGRVLGPVLGPGSPPGTLVWSFAGSWHLGWVLGRVQVPGLGPGTWVGEIIKDIAYLHNSGTSNHDTGLWLPQAAYIEHI